MNKAFEVHVLNKVGKLKARLIAEAFDSLVEKLPALGCAPGREFALVTTFLEQACFFAKKSMATAADHQQHPRAIEVLAEDMFNAYNREFPNPWKTYDGRPVPPWSELNDQVRAKWIAAAKASVGDE